MSKSKSRNIKRSRMLRQRKKARELGEKENEVHGLPQMEKRLKNRLGIDVEVRNKNATGKKISNVVSQMIQPLMKGARSFKEEQNIIGLGIMAWNLGVVKAYKGEKEMLKSLEEFKMMFPDVLKEVMMEYVEIKCTDYEEYDQFIYDYEFTRIDGSHNNLTVAYESVQE